MRTHLLAAAALALTIAGCALWSRPLVPVRYYAIEPPGTAPKAGVQPADAVLAVRSLASASRYRERILFRKGGLAAGYHDSDRWLEPPAEMVTAVVRRTLDGAGVARVVADDHLVRRPDFVLEGRLTRFDEAQRHDAWLAECELELVLKQGEDGAVLLSARFAASREAKAKSTPAFVEAMNAAVADVAAQTAAAVARTLAARKPGK